MYNRLTKLNPFWNKVVIANVQDGEPVRALVDLAGTHLESNVIATSFDIGIPLLRKAYRPDITVEEAKDVITDIMSTHLTSPLLCTFATKRPQLISSWLLPQSRRPFYQAHEEMKRTMTISRTILTTRYSIILISPTSLTTSKTIPLTQSFTN